jgi:hypothetical protein
MQVSQLWRYPVKSMLGGTVDEIELDHLGIVGDRTWATRDLERGGIRGAKKIGQLMKFAARDLDELVWASKPGARHSLNIAERGRASLVIFDSGKEPGDGSALYIDAEASSVDGADFDHALAIYNERSLLRGLPEWTPATLREPAKHRLYRARTLEAFVLDDHDERVRVGAQGMTDA